LAHQPFLQRRPRVFLSGRWPSSFRGGLWALLQPLIQLAVYGFVWKYVFRMSAPGGADGPGIVAFLAMGVWPWNAFSESLVRATTAMRKPPMWRPMAIDVG
jgi:ABC-type polysaccharide/polyol phosphate export permease